MAEGPQTAKQHPIPQQVLGIEFKLVGDLTLRQLGYLAACGILAYAAYASPLPTLLRLTFAFTLGIIGVALALIPVQDQPLDQWVLNLFRAIYSPTRWVWQRIAEPPEFLIAPIPKFAEPAKEAVSPEETQRRLREYLATLKEEEELEPVDLAEKQRLESLNLEMRTVMAEAAPPMIPTAPPAVSPPEPGELEGPPEAAPPPPVPPTARPLKPSEIEKPPVPTVTEVPLLPKRRFEEAKEKPSLASTINYAAGPILKIQRGPSITYTTTLQNVKVGRKLRPITGGEVVFAPAKERVITIEPPEVTPPTLPPTPPPTPAEVKPPTSIAPPPTPVEEPSEPTEEIKPAPPTPPIEEVPAAKPTPPKPPALPAPEVMEKPPAPERVVKAPPPEEAKPPLAKEPNVINGIVYDKGGEVIEGVLVVVKTPAGEARRATKTNQLGQFFFSPLPNGRYLVELPRVKPPSAIIEIELTGRPVPLLEMKPEK